MCDKLKSLFLLPLLFLISWTASAQKVSFELNAPQVVAVGEVFRVEFVANAKPKELIQPTFEGMDLLAGPSLATSRNVSIVNGNMEQSTQYTYTYVLQCNSEGEFTISEAGIVVGKETIKTRPHTVKAINEPTQGAAAQQDLQSQDGAAVSKATVSPDDIRLVATVDKRKVFKGEPVRVTFKLYSRLQIADVTGAKMPAFNGFWSQQLEQTTPGGQREEFDGKIYNAWVIREYLLFPQMAGTLTIDPLELTAIAQIITQPQRQSIFDDFFGGPNIQEVRRSLATSPLKITVNELPAGAPDSFNGAVGEFELSYTLPNAEILANSAVNYTVKISGTGNLSQIQAPKLNLPASFEQYNVKTTETLNNTKQGIHGYRQFEYPFIARVVGEYDIEPVKFSYFNPRQARYQTLTTPAMTLRVLPDSTARGIGGGGMISGISKEDIKILGRDIRFIKLGQSELRPKGKVFVGSPLYIGIILALTGLSVFLFVWMKKFMEERRNSALLRGKRANKVALLRFRAAEGHMKADNQRGFYDEMLKALWGYMSDKLNIPVANLTKENIREELIKKGVSHEQAARYIEIIGECEYAQYAPAVSGRMNEVYAAGVEIITRLEDIIGK